MKAYKTNKFLGVDFSGGSHAGKKIWVAEAALTGDLLTIAQCIRGDELPASASVRETCLAALRSYVAAQGPCIIGMDFPFGIAQSLITTDSWKEWVYRFPDVYLSPRVFRAKCLAAAGKKELKRQTERDARTPFNPYNLRLHRQTFFGICDVLLPLIRDNQARIAPMQALNPRLPIIVEVCSSCTIRARFLFRPYKGKDPRHREARFQVVKFLLAGGLRIPSKRLQTRLIEDEEGDAIDSVVAATSAYRALYGSTTILEKPSMPYRIEGQIFL